MSQPPVFQQTLAAPLVFTGRGIHSGLNCRMTLCPAPPETGVRFQRTDLPGNPEIPARLEQVAEAPLLRQMVLCLDGDLERSVQTVEHILAVFHALGVDNARVEMTGPESPIGNGSAGELARRVAAIGVVPQSGAPRRCIRIPRPLALDLDGVSFAAWPSESLIVTYFLEYAHPAIGSQAVSFRIAPDRFTEEIAPARTFCTEEEVDMLRQMGLIKGGDADNAVVFGQQGPINTELLWPDEPARHKLLDLVGDLYLLGAPVRGHIVACKGGHRANHLFLQHIRKELTQA